jgi:hypothetical protein
MRIEVVAGEEVAAVIVSAVIARAASQRQPPLRFRLPICNHRLQPRSPRRQRSRVMVTRLALADFDSHVMKRSIW